MGPHARRETSIRLLSIASAALSASAPAALATIALNLSDGTAPAGSVEITPGQSFDVAATLVTDEGVVGFTYFLTISGAGSGKFSITARTIPPESPFQDKISSDAAVLSPDAALLNPHSDRDLGLLADIVTEDQPPGTYLVSTFTITTAADLAPGTYTLSISGGETDVLGANSALDDSHRLPIVPGSYTIVVPGDPGSGGGGGGGGGTGEDPPPDNPEDPVDDPGDDPPEDPPTDPTDPTDPSVPPTDPGPDTPVTDDPVVVEPSDPTPPDTGEPNSGGSGDSGSGEEPVEERGGAAPLCGAGAGGSAFMAGLLLAPVSLLQRRRVRQR
ncbi:MAG: hypothetical protein AMXMBFR13_50970 [Phycisphaerae bacterium]